MADDINITVDLKVIGNRDILTAQKSLSRMQRELATLAIAEKQGTVAAGSFNKALQQSQSQLAKKTGSLTNATRVMQQYGKALRNASVDQIEGARAMNQLGSIASASTRKLKRFSSVGLQQVGYQVGDFAVQIQGGTNAMVALGQQGSQLLGIFGAWGAVAGAALAIITAFLAPLFSMAKAAKEAAQGLDTLQDRLKSAREQVRGMAADLEMVRLGFKNAFEKAFVDQVDNARDALKAAREELEAIQRRGPTAADPTGEAARDDAAVRAAQEKVALAVRELAQAQELSRQKEQQERDEATINGLHKARLILQEKAREEQEAINKQLENARKMGNAVREATDSIAIAMRGIAGLDISGPFARALSFATQLFNKAKAIAEVKGGRLRFGSNTGFGTGPSLVRDPRTGEYVTSGQTGITGGSNLPFMTVPDAVSGGGSSGGGRGGGGGSGGTPQEDYLKKLLEEAQLKQRLVGLSEEETRRIEIIEELKKRDLDTGDKRIEMILQTEKTTRDLIQAEQERENLLKTVESNVESFIDSLVDGTTSIEDAFKGMLRNILQEIWNTTVSKPIAGFASDFLGGILGNANGNAFMGGRVTAFANGGVVNSPTMFPMANGTGLMGEAGPEAVMPLKRGKNGKLGVASEGGQSVVVNQSFNFSANGDESVKRIIAQEAPKIASLTQKQILDQRQRGGAFKATFG